MRHESQSTLSAMRHESQSTLHDVANNIILVPVTHLHVDFVNKIGKKIYGKTTDVLTTFMDPKSFSNGEFCPKFAGNNKQEITQKINNKHIYIVAIADPDKPPGEIMYRCGIMAASAKDYGAKNVTIVFTDIPNARQDRGHEEDEKIIGEPFTSRINARNLHSMGVDTIITLHEHSPRLSAIYGLEFDAIPSELLKSTLKDRYTGQPAKDIIIHKDFFDANNPELQEAGRKIFKTIRLESLVADYLLHESILHYKNLLVDKGKKITFKAVDNGNCKFIDEICNAMFSENVSRLYYNKIRTEKNDPDYVNLTLAKASENFTSLNGGIEIYADDLLETGGSIIKHTNISRKGDVLDTEGNTISLGIPEDRLIYFTHASMSGKGATDVQKKLIKTGVSEITMTNTHPYISTVQEDNFKRKSTVLLLANLIGDAIQANELGLDIHERYIHFESEEIQHKFIKPLYTIYRNMSNPYHKGNNGEKDILFVNR
jgi:phosphoribosylpyrophosphate synthetase